MLSLFPVLQTQSPQNPLLRGGRQRTAGPDINVLWVFELTKSSLVQSFPPAQEAGNIARREQARPPRRRREQVRPPRRSRAGAQENILVITGEELRHQYFTNLLNARFRLTAALTEKTDYPSPPGTSEEEKKAWDWFFTRRAAYESQIFGAAHRLPTINDPPTIRIQKGKLNSPETVKLLQEFQPGFIALYGTGMLKETILNQFPGRIFNLHVGLPGFFRGSSCNFWPIHDKQLEKLGAAVHLTNRGIDKGEIAAQASIELEDRDDEQTLAGKTLIVGTQLMISTIRNWRNGTLNFSHAAKPGKLYLRKDFTPGAVLSVRQMVESGELKDELKKILERKKQIRSVRD